MNAAWVRGLALSLAVMAITLKIMIPAGFMAGPSSLGSAPLVLCTAQGMMLVDPSDLPSQDPTNPAPGKSSSDVPCAFAGHGVSGLIANTLATGAVETVAYLAARPLATQNVTPGRGLAAPPPPARGPPLSI
jgi:hypothetical protein